VQRGELGEAGISMVVISDVRVSLCAMKSSSPLNPLDAAYVFEASIASRPAFR
jgi:hypothetical protein